jgi:hypothetical protein
VLDREPFLPEEFRAALRAPVDLGAGARARVMQRVRAAAMAVRVAPQPRGIARPSIVGALLAASFVGILLAGGARSGGDDGVQRTLADTIAMHFAAAADAVTNTAAIDRTRLVAVADETRNAAPAPRARRD